MRKFHAAMTWQWALHLPVVTTAYPWLPETGERVSILYLALVSITSYANMATHWGAYQAARAEEAASTTE